VHAESLRRVAELEAQLARREAELEERNYGPMPINVPRLDPPLPQLSRDGAIRVLQQSAARNEALTHEIADLVHKVMLASNIFSWLSTRDETELTHLVYSSKMLRWSWNRRTFRIPQP
jgi:hypothetical protein